MGKRSLVFTLTLTVIMSMILMSMPLRGGMAAGETPTPPPTATTIPPVELGSGGTHISFWNGLTGSDGTTLNAMLTQFVKENPDVSVTTEIIPWTTLYTKLQAAFIANQPPDLFLLHASEIPQFASYGALMDLSSWYDIGGGPLPSKDFAQPGFDGILVDGKPYAVELDNHGRGTWVNTDLLAKAGVDASKPPANRDEAIAIFQKLTIDKNGKNAADAAFDPKNVVQWGTVVNEWIYVDFESYLWGNGGSIISDDGKTATINSDAGVKALQTMYDLVYKYHVAPVPAGFDTWQSFAGGKVALLPTGTWFRNFAADQKDLKWTTWPTMPLGDKPAAWFGAHAFMIPAGASGAKLDAAKKLVLWVAEHQKDWAASGQVPSRLSAQKALDPATYPSNIYIGKTFTQFGHMEVRSPVLLELQDAIAPELDAALNNQKPVKQALDDAAKRMQGILDRAGK